MLQSQLFECIKKTGKSLWVFFLDSFEIFFEVLTILEANFFWPKIKFPFISGDFRGEKKNCRPVNYRIMEDTYRVE